MKLKFLKKINPRKNPERGFYEFLIRLNYEIGV